MKLGLLSLQLRDQLLGTVNGDPIVYREQYSLIPRNRFVDFAALLAHWNYPFRTANRSKLVGCLNG
jgi:hypothetical protein